MFNFKNAVLGLLLGLCSVFSLRADNVVINTPSGFQVLAISPNGKWACGVYVNANLDTYGFRWNLEGGSIEMLGGGVTTAWDIANDGTVSGDFTDKTTLPGGAPVILPGYWRDGSWHSIEVPNGKITDGIGCGISPDGHYITGSVCVDGIYKGFIWKDGKLHRELSSLSHAVPSAVSPDGNAAAGYTTLKNRTACYWAPDGSVVTFLDSPLCPQSPWNYSRNFSPDGKRVLYWGGWELTEDESELYLYSIYDIASGERIKVKAPSIESDVELYDISNSSLLVGQDHNRGYVYTSEGEGMYVDDYLQLRGVDLSTFEDFYKGGDHYVGQLPILRVVSVSEDDKVLACNYYNTTGESASLIIKIDQDFSSVVPAEVSASQLQGLNTVALKWRRPVGVAGVRGYSVYRDGKKISGIMPLNVPYYYDKDLAEGIYTYEVSAITTAGIETRGEAIEVEVAANTIQRPLSVYGRQKGYSNAYASWLTPFSNIAHKHYFDPESSNIEGFGIYGSMQVEMAINFDKAELATYKNHKISEVSFMPMAEQRAWEINLYTRDNNGALSLLASQPVTQQLEYGKINTVKLATPVDIPSSDLVVAIGVSTGENQLTIGAQNEKATPRYSDLLRQKTDADFFSTYESSVATGYDISSMSWVIDLGLTPVSYSDADNTVAQYNIYLNEELQAQTDENAILIEGLETGNYTLGVEAVYAGGKVSPMSQTAFHISSGYPAINNVDIAVDDKETPTLTAKWEAPVDNDLTSISYTTAEKHATGIKGVQENGYALMASAIYPASMFRTYGGYNVKSLRFYPLADALFTLMLYENDKLVAEVEVDDFTIGQWNEVALPETLKIKEGVAYRLVLDCFDPEPDVPLIAIDSSIPQPYAGELYSIDNGESWESLSYNTGANGNWMLGMKIVDGDSEESSALGYDVLIDGIVRNTSMLTEPSFAYTFDKVDAHMHTLKINTYYPLVASPVSGKNTFFSLKSSGAGVDDSVIASITLRQGNNYLVAEGENVESIEVYSTSGQQVAVANDNRVNISHLTSGLYIATVRANGKTTIHKINIKR